MEYRHGPIAVTGPGRVVWMLGQQPDGLARDVAEGGGLIWHPAEAAAARWPSWSACTGSPPRSAEAAGSTPTGRAT